MKEFLLALGFGAVIAGVFSFAEHIVTQSISDEDRERSERIDHDNHGAE